MAILAHHAHVFPASIRKEATIERLLQLLDACGIEQAVCFSPFPYQCEGSAIAGRQNAWLVEEMAQRGAGRLHGFGTIDLRRDDLEAQVRDAVALGLKGLKLHPQAQQFPLLSPQARRVYAAAEQHDLFITFHSGIHARRIRDSRVVDFDEVAQDYPRLRFSLEHVGGYHFFNEALAVLVNNKPASRKNALPGRVYAGLTSVFTSDFNRPWYLGRQRLDEIVAQVGPDLMIFGLDFPYNREPETQLGLKTIEELGLTPEDTANILGGNLRRILKLDDA